jgi:hypothetical protein
MTQTTLECFHRNGLMVVRAQFTPDDLGRLGVFFTAIREMLEVGAQYAPILNRHRLMLGSDLSDDVIQ